MTNDDDALEKFEGEEDEEKVQELSSNQTEAIQESSLREEVGTDNSTHQGQINASLAIEEHFEGEDLPEQNETDIKTIEKHISELQQQVQIKAGSETVVSPKVEPIKSLA